MCLPERGQTMNYCAMDGTRHTKHKNCWCQIKHATQVKLLSPHDALKHHLTSLKTDLISLQLRGLEGKLPWNCFTNTRQFFLPTSCHLHSLQVENCDSKSRLVVDEDDNDKFRLERVLKNLTANKSWHRLVLSRRWFEAAHIDLGIRTIWALHHVGLDVISLRV